MLPRLIAALLSSAICLVLLAGASGCERDAEQPAAPTAPPAEGTVPTPPPTPPPAPSAGDATRTRAQTLIDQVNQLIKDGQLQAAETRLGELEAMRTRLPESMQQQIESAKASLEGARSTRGAGSPGR